MNVPSLYKCGVTEEWKAFSIERREIDHWPHQQTPARAKFADFMIKAWINVGSSLHWKSARAPPPESAATTFRCDRKWRGDVRLLGRLLVVDREPVRPAGLNGGDELPAGRSVWV